MDASDYKGLKSEMIENNKLEVLCSMTTHTMHATRQRVLNFHFALPLDFTVTDSVNQSVHQSVCPSASVSVSQSVCLSVCLSVS